MPKWQRTRDCVAAHYWARRSCWPTNPLLARSIETRFPYMDPLNHLQIALLRRYREHGAPERVTDEFLRRGIHITINGIAAGLRNSG
ncbi:phosphoenolpyruvate carboxylase [Gemmatimonas sp.]|uniref:phosphoenolpyruvate carboxylase n=1 Tax=Gemmatimonas sp. TaxID=1962908 RepID=UPI003DA5567E